MRSSAPSSTTAIASFLPHQRPADAQRLSESVAVVLDPFHLTREMGFHFLPDTIQSITERIHLALVKIIFKNMSKNLIYTITAPFRGKISFFCKLLLKPGRRPHPAHHK